MSAVEMYSLHWIVVLQRNLTETQKDAISKDFNSLNLTMYVGEMVSICCLIVHILHYTDALICLSWLRVQQSIEFKLTMLTYKLLFNQALHYLGPVIRVVDLSG